MLKLKKTNESKFGTSVKVNFGKQKSISETGCTNGTTVMVKDLFLNVPARLKFLKSAITEFGHISEIVFKESLSYPNISFKLLHNKQIVYNAQNIKEKKDMEEVKNRIVLYYGKETENDLILMQPEFCGNITKISGIISKPSLNRPNRSNQPVFVNNRPVFDKVVANAISSAYETLLPKDRYPFVALFIEINPELVDVNVHPTKREIKFSKPNDVHRDIVNAIKETLEKNNIIKKSVFETIPDASYNCKENNYKSVDMTSRPLEIKEAIQEYLSSNTPDESGNYNTNINLQKDFPLTKKLLQVYNSYIIVESNSPETQGIYIIDQHAAHERIIYEDIINHKIHKSTLIESQGLLIPINFSLSSKESGVVKENMEYFEELGFEIADMGKNSFSVHAIPKILADKDCGKILKDILSDLSDEKITDRIKSKDKIIKTIACRSAIMANDKLEQPQMELIVDKIEKCKIPYCPHGRPAVVFLSLPEINKMFNRK